MATDTLTASINTESYVEVGELSEWNSTKSENQEGNYFDRRFVKALEDGTFRVITVSAFAVQTFDLNEEADGYDIEVQTEILDCTDYEEPGETEINSDYEYTNSAFDFGFEDQEAATNAARNYIRNLEADRF